MEGKEVVGTPVLDRFIGEAQLEHLNVLNDLIVVYLSEHGEILGEKRQWEKEQQFDASVRVPRNWK